MNFWTSMWAPIRSWWGGGRQQSGSQSTGPMGSAYTPNVTVTEETALQLTAVWACVRLISQTVASLPLIVYRTTPKGREIVTDHWFSDLMRRPNKYQTRYEFWEHQVANLALHGNMYARKGERAGRIISLIPLNPLQTETKILAGDVAHLFSTDGDVAVLSAQSVWHARMNGDLVVGKSPLQFGAKVLGVAQSAEQQVVNVYANGGKPSGVLSLDRLLTADQRRAARESFGSLTTGTDERLLVLEQGMKFEPISLSPEDIQLLESRRYQLEEICRWFGVPSVLVNDTSGSTTWGSGIAELVSGFYKLNLRPYLEAIENSISTHLLSDEDVRNGIEVEFDFEGLLRADQRSRFEGYAAGINNGILTPNEARAMEWLPRVAGGDRLLIQGAMVPVERAGIPSEDGNGI